MSVAVIGAGPAGLAAAYTLTKVFPNVDVYEASDDVGGLARSLRLWGQTVDLGPHRFFSRDRRVNELWLEVVGRDYAMVRRLTRILYKGRFFQYPLEPLGALSNLGVSEAVRCATSYAWAKLRPLPQDGSFETWMTSRFGRRLYEVFFESYSEKLWGIPCNELDADFAAQRIKQFSLSAAAMHALWPRHLAAHRTLCDEFAYPLEGTGMVYARMAQAIQDRGGRLFLQTPVKRVIARQSRCEAIQLQDETVRQYDTVISTMPLTLLVERLTEAPQQIKQLSAKLTFRNTILVYLEVADSDICKDNWVYVQERGLRTGRITNFRNWVPQLYGSSPNTILALEYWCNFDEELWRANDSELIALAKQELVATALVSCDQRITNAAIYRIPRCYPVYRRGYREILASIRNYLVGIEGLQVIGRYGAFKYNNQDHSILMGLLAADNVFGRAENDLWGVNCDDIAYQESCRITETGLVPTG